MIAILCAFQFLTILPPIIRRSFTAQEMGRSVAYYPLVGLALGGVLYGVVVALDSILSPQLLAVVLLGLWLILTRSLHFDGFLDACDGLFGAFTPEKRLEIMHDPRVGAFGVAGGVLLLLAKFSALLSLDHMLAALLLSPVFGRLMMSAAIVLYPYGREKGLGRDIKNNAGWVQLLIALLLSAAITWATAGWYGMIVLLFILVLGNLWILFVLKRIPGLTGDIYGATCEICELLTLVSFTLNVV